MTGFTKEQAYTLGLTAKNILEKHGITVLSPIFDTGIKPAKQKIKSLPSENFLKEWKKDKELIRRSHILLDIVAEAKSEGVAHEIAYARYFLWKPVVRVSKKYVKKGCSVAFYEDDLIVSSIEEAAKLMKKRWGTYELRKQWRVKMLRRSLPKFVRYQIEEFK
jgi:hypothetical protein